MVNNMVLQSTGDKFAPDRTQENDDNEFIRRCREGDVDTFGEIVQKYQKTIYNIAFRMVGDPTDAEHITQTTFMKAYERINLYKRRHPFFIWIHKIAVNETLNFIKRQQEVVGLKDMRQIVESTPETEHYSNERQKRIECALEKLPTEQRIVIVLRHVGDFSYREISKILDISEKTVKLRLFTAREEMCNFLR